MNPEDIAAAIERRCTEGHQCAAPLCPETATCAFVFRRLAHLAGRWWQPGDYLDVCARHAAQVYESQRAVVYADLPGWLRPFPESTPPQARASVGRLIGLV